MRPVRAFIDYYRALDISPVQQDLSDLGRHFRRRDSLYRFLGIPALAIRGARIAEFGPGSGHNALHTAQLGPARYLLVDGNPRGVSEMRRLFAQHGLRAPIEIVESLIEDFATEERFDVVLAEGLIPLQQEPARFARHIASFVASGGILVITCIDAASAMADFGRRLAARRLAPPTLPVPERVARLSETFAPHLATLAGMSRPVGDWVYDNVIHPFTGRLFSIGDAIAVLGDGFDVYGSSPRFVVDWRWYKQVAQGDRGFNRLALEAYHANVVNLLDYRITLAPQAPELGAAILSHCQELYGLMQRIELGSDESAMTGVLATLERLGKCVALISPPTAQALASLRSFLAAPSVDPARLDGFASHFGRGMQYLSFLRRQ